jgi:hypothetical protein
VLGWAAGLATLVVASSLLVEFAYGIAAERALLRAARAGALEAALPRATRATIESTILRRLTDYPTVARSLRLGVHQNGAPTRGAILLHHGDRVLVTLTAPRDAASPSWIQRISFWQSDEPLQAQAEGVVPGRSLAPQSN